MASVVCPPFVWMNSQDGVGVFAPPEVLRTVFVLALPNYNDCPLDFGRRRGQLALVCRYWAAVVYGDTSLWASVTVTRHTRAHMLRRVLEFSASRPLRIKLAFESFSHRTVGRSAAAVNSLDDIFAVLSPTSRRWTSFVFSCQNPIVFGRVNEKCANLEAPLLGSMSILYWYLPGYDPVVGDQTYLRPFSPLPWFSRSVLRLRGLELNGIPLLWETPLLFNHLEVVDLSDFPSNAPLGWEVFSALFLSATRLRILRIGSIHTGPSDRTCPLLSNSLEELDVRFVGSPALGLLVQRMVLPSIKTLVVRGFYQVDLFSVLLWPYCLSRVLRFEVRGWLGSGEDVWPLFDSLKKVEEFDFTHARGEMFGSFYEWSLARVDSPTPRRSRSITRLCVGHVDTQILVRYCGLRGVGCQPRRAGDLEFIRLEKPSFARVATVSTDADVRWLESNLTALEFSYFYQECNQALSTITCHSLHHHFV
ncbi:hypothetical protein C8R47DRAFT_1323290 [Mycena vitilis]|nr:hypothetical protein C8R47DRAFT_1323290 [Mycena vitilis]